MIKAQTLQDLFKRYRRPGDLFYSIISIVFSLFLAFNMRSETVSYTHLTLPTKRIV